MPADGTKVTIDALLKGLLIETGIRHTFVVDGPTIRLVSVEAPTFVPGEEKIDISYAIDGPVSQAALVQLKIWSAPPKGERVAVGLIDIPGPYSANGKFTWDGAINQAGKVITLKGSPYEVEFVLQAKTGSIVKSSTGKIELAVESIKILVDNKAAFVGVGAPKAVDDLATELKNSGMPGDCEGRLVLESPVFKVTDGEMDYADSFVKYKDAVGNGPPVPLLAEIALKSKAGGGKRAPAALTGTRVLWDFKLESSSDLDGSMSARGVNPPAKAFIKKVASYEEAATQPKGVSAHMKAGGWRAKSADRDAVGRQWGKAGAWTFTAGATRDWAAFTTCAKDAISSNDTAVYFSPGRMGGDTHRVTAVVDVDDALDVADESAPNGAPAPHRSNTVKMTIWRRVPIVGNWIVGAGTIPATIPPLTEEYKKAAMLIEQNPGVVVQDMTASWKAAYQASVTYLSARDPFFKDALEADPRNYAVRYRDYSDYWERTSANAGFFGKLWDRIKHFFSSSDEKKYKKKCDDNWWPVMYYAALRLTLPPRGITAMKWGTEGPHNQRPTTEYTAGIAPSIPRLTGRNRAIFFQFTPSAGSETFIHEVGHQLFLAHAPGHYAPPEQPDGYQVEAHDKNQVCLMSYSPRKQHLCGLCLLKLAGWNAFRIRSDGSYDV